MTEKEAIKILEKPSEHIRVVHKTNEMQFYTFSSDLVRAFEMAIQALEKQTMCNEILHEWKEARDKAIDDFAEMLCEALQDQATEVQMEDGILYDILTVDGVTDIVMEIAERMKNGEINTKIKN